MIKAWWEQLSLRDQRVLTIGVPVAMALLVYALIWSPLVSALHDRHEQMERAQNLFQFMRLSSAQMARYGQVTQASSLSGDMLSIVESQLARKGLASRLKSVTEPTDNQVLLVFSHVPFDQLMSVLQQLWQHNGLKIKQFKALKSEAPGVADVTVLLVS